VIALYKPSLRSLEQRTWVQPRPSANLSYDDLSCGSVEHREVTVKLRKVLVQNYRSIVDSGTAEIEDGVTVVIGKNEQGKSNFLKAISAFNEGQHFSPNDLPNHLRPDLEDRNASEIPVVTLWFALEAQDRKRLAGVIRNIDLVAELKSVKHYGNNYGFSVVSLAGEEGRIEYAPPDLSAPLEQIRKTAEDLRSKLHAHASRLPPFASNGEKIDQITSALLTSKPDPTDLDNVIKTFTTSIKVLTGVD